MHRKLPFILCSFIFIVSFCSASASEAKAEERLYYIHQDHLGSTTVITDENGNVVSQQSYFPYGETREQQLVVDNQISRQYTSQVSDQDQTGLYYYNARYYNPQITLFNRPDPLGNNFNRYAYVESNPIIYIDPSGYDLMIAGGTKTDLNIDDWKYWIMNYKGWQEDEWIRFRNGYLNYWENDQISEAVSYLNKFNINMFTWGASSRQEAIDLSWHSSTKDMLSLLKEQLHGMEHVTMLGFSKGGVLAIHYLNALDRNQDYEDVITPINTVLIQPATAPIADIAVGLFDDNPINMNFSIPDVEDLPGVKNVVNICIQPDFACSTLSNNIPNVISYSGWGGGYAHNTHSPISESIFNNLINISGNRGARSSRYFHTRKYSFTVSYTEGTVFQGGGGGGVRDNKPLFQ